MKFFSHRKFQIQNPVWQSRVQGVELASFRSRAIAFMIDGLIIVILRQILGGSILGSEAQVFSWTWNIGAFYSAVFVIAYSSLMTWWGRGATPGKRMMGIRVVSLTHDRLSLWHCIERALGYTASWLEAGFGFLQYFTHPNNQTVHDRIAETIVVNIRQDHEIAAHQPKHPLRCECGRVQGHVNISGALSRGICYCKDCQSFAYFLGKEKQTLNEIGGTDIVPASPRDVAFTQGKELLACMQLSDKGLLRWYASCCNTPIGNTWRNNKLSYVGLIHNCLEHSDKSIEESFGPVKMQVHPHSAKSEVKLKSSGTIAALAGWITMMLGELISGRYKRSPFFDAKSGASLVAPTVLTLEQRRELRSKL
jgi:uncharacterized RDD family membrane protein YckC